MESLRSHWKEEAVSLETVSEEQGKDGGLGFIYSANNTTSMATLGLAPRTLVAGPTLPPVSCMGTGKQVASSLVMGRGAVLGTG